MDGANAVVVDIPYLYFMDTTNPTDIITDLDSMTCFNIIYSDTRTVSILYRPADNFISTRSIVLFNEESDFQRWSWSSSESHMFILKDPTNTLYMSDFYDDVPLIHPILLKFHQLLGIAYSKLIGFGGGGYAALKFNSMFYEIAPWTMTMTINAELRPSIDWTIDFTPFKIKFNKGKHLYFIIQNVLDKKHYADFLSIKDVLQENNLTGWCFKSLGSTFYNNSLIDHHKCNLDKNTVFDFIEWIMTGSKESQSSASMYGLKREF
jgi:hypothetical protein